MRAVDRPVDASQSAIAVRKGNGGLLDDINHGLAEIRRDGTYDRIVRSWTPQEVVYLTREHRRRVEAQKESLVQQLQVSLKEIKTLRGIVPICARCEKIRDDHGFWTQVEAYISERTDAELSHGLCPECTRALYPDFADRPNEG